MKIPPAHPFFLAESKVQEICAPFFEQHDFSYFQYVRLHKNKTMTGVISNTQLVKKFIDIDYPSFSSFDEAHEEQKNYWFLWDEELPWHPVKMARDYAGFHNGLAFIRRSQDHFDMIAVARKTECATAGSFYLSRQQAIQDFIQHFEKAAHNLLQAVEADPIQLGENNVDSNLDKILLNRRLSVVGKAGRTYLTPQEFLCLNLWIKGYSHKEIAQDLGVAPTTVITYLSRLKERTGCRSKQDLRQLFAAL